jgi:hypothetical protein
MAPLERSGSNWYNRRSYARIRTEMSLNISEQMHCMYVEAA